jgi:probable rRNA maturation factor
MKSANSAKRDPAKRPKRSPAPSRALRLTIQNATQSSTIPATRQFRNWIRAALRADGSITVRLVGLREGRALNRTYRGKDYATNVLTFVLHDTPPFEGDLALCVPVVTREARAQRKALSAHYAHLTVHAVLHLQGYQHDEESDAVRMEKLEKRILKQLGYPDPYATQLNHG